LGAYLFAYLKIVKVRRAIPSRRVSPSSHRGGRAMIREGIGSNFPHGEKKGSYSWIWDEGGKMRMF
jgi:hypothetical protein